MYVPRASWLKSPSILSFTSFVHCLSLVPPTGQKGVTLHLFSVNITIKAVKTLNIRFCPKCVRCALCFRTWHCCAVDGLTFKNLHKFLFVAKLFLEACLVYPTLLSSLTLNFINYITTYFPFIYVFIISTIYTMTW